MNTKAQDVLVSIKIMLKGWPASYAELGRELGMSTGGVHQAVQRAVGARLLDRNSKWAVKRSLAEFLVHGVKYAFPVERGPMTRGIPTSYAAPPLSSQFHIDDSDIPVWPHPEGTVRGWTLAPLCRSVPVAALRDEKLYQWLAMVDAIRFGRARERDVATSIIEKHLSYEGN